jgi:phosphatidylinositol 4-phosphatase
MSILVVAISDINVNEHQFGWSIISRRSIQRAGTRLFYRGIDQNVSWAS